jgi:hypothetical protein
MKKFIKINLSNREKVFEWVNMGVTQLRKILKKLK